MFKLIILIMLLGVIGSLFSGLFFLYRDQGTGDRTVKALTLRISLSIALFVLLMLGYRFGLITG
ncbi:MAG: twin transmembrane helix small protein [Propionivibrio sp.]|uniref:Twin transmembrane helix small protein n=1 Tax=Candidatus Propionivibrio dominans TaxID=2954373 RepID=A0A9D7FBG8_9RHOO|nr:twin transmembrane helix small protein [Candidatus Propionivibrio dominans]